MKKDQALNRALQQAVDLMNADQFAKAEMVLNTILSHYPKVSDAYNLLGTLYHKTGKNKVARPLIEKAIKLNSKKSYYHNNLGNVYRELGEHKISALAFRRAVKLNPKSAAARSNLGNMYVVLGDADKGIREQKKAIEIQPDYHLGHFNLGNAYLEKGMKEEAIVCYRRTIELDPTYAKAYRNIVESQKIKTINSDVTALEGLLNSGNVKSVDDRVQLLFGAAKSYNDLKDTGTSWKYLKEGNDLHRSTYEYDVQVDLSIMEDLKQSITAEYINENRRTMKSSPTPIFILGMPRSGTSLVEQILASHPKVFGAGELYFLELLVHNQIKQGRKVEFRDILPTLQTQDLEEFSKFYLGHLKALPTKAKLITDKMPRNFMYVGLIKILFPDAKIIHCRRQPEDSCLSIYKKIFVGKQKFAYDLDELGKYYNGYLDLMDHWHNIMPGEILDLQYEEMVADTEGQTRRLLEYCNVDWHDDCLNFHTTQRVVRTASSDQVRQPIYKSSVAAWKQFEQQLAPLSAVLNSRNT